MKCAVVGASGFVGRAVVDELCRQGATAVEVTRVNATLGDPNTIADVITGCDAVVHAAGVADPSTSPVVCGWVDVAGTENVLAAAAHAGVRRVVYISCAAVSVYLGARPGWNEARFDKSKPLSPWVDTKRMADQIVAVAPDTIALRPALLWGPGDRRNLMRWCEQGTRRGIVMPGAGRHLLSTTYIGNLTAAVWCALCAEPSVSGVFHVLDAEMSLAREFFVELSDALGLRTPKRGWPTAAAIKLSRLKSLLGASPVHPVDLAVEGYSTSLDGRAAREQLDYSPPVTRAQGMEALARWVTALGGPETIVSQRRVPMGEQDIDDQRRLAAAVGRRELR